MPYVCVWGCVRLFVEVVGSALGVPGNVCVAVCALSGWECVCVCVSLGGSVWIVCGRSTCPGGSVGVWEAGCGVGVGFFVGHVSVSVACGVRRGEAFWAGGGAGGGGRQAGGQGSSPPSPAQWLG